MEKLKERINQFVKGHKKLFKGIGTLSPKRRWRWGIGDGKNKLYEMEIYIESLHDTVIIYNLFQKMVTGYYLFENGGFQRYNFQSGAAEEDNYVAMDGIMRV